MKVAIVLMALVAVVVCENCTMSTDCKVTQCIGDRETIHCVDNLCTCTRDGGGTCVRAEDCPTCDRNERRHCIDGRCRCSRF